MLPTRWTTARGTRTMFPFIVSHRRGSLPGCTSVHLSRRRRESRT